jgi:hypothetical protein
LVSWKIDQKRTSGKVAIAATAKLAAPPQDGGNETHSGLAVGAGDSCPREPPAVFLVLVARSPQADSSRVEALFLSNGDHVGTRPQSGLLDVGGANLDVCKSVT